MKRLTVVAMCVSNEDRSPVEINRCDAAPTPTGFAEIVSDDFPVVRLGLSPGFAVRFRRPALCPRLLFRRLPFSR
jgi:hypothetical protein